MQCTNRDGDRCIPTLFQYKTTRYGKVGWAKGQARPDGGGSLARAQHLVGHACRPQMRFAPGGGAVRKGQHTLTGILQGSKSGSGSQSESRSRSRSRFRPSQALQRLVGRRRWDLTGEVTISLRLSQPGAKLPASGARVPAQLGADPAARRIRRRSQSINLSVVGWIEERNPAFPLRNTVCWV